MDLQEEKNDEIMDSATNAESTEEVSAELKDEAKIENTLTETADTDKKDEKNRFFKKKGKVQSNDLLNKKIEELTVKTEEQGKLLIEINDKYLRLSAEFDNYRKRTLKEKMELTKYANEAILLSIIPVIDDFERAISHFDSAKDIDSVKEGVTHIYSKFKEYLAQKGVKEIDAINLDFNTDLHEAITKIPSPSEEMKGKVIDVAEKGYMLYDKVIRFSKVVVGE